MDLLTFSLLSASSPLSPFLVWGHHVKKRTWDHWDVLICAKRMHRSRADGAGESRANPGSPGRTAVEPMCVAFILVVLDLVWFVTSTWLERPSKGPLASGGAFLHMSHWLLFGCQYQSIVWKDMCLKWRNRFTLNSTLLTHSTRFDDACFDGYFYCLFVVTLSELLDYKRDITNFHLSSLKTAGFHLYILQVVCGSGCNQVRRRCRSWCHRASSNHKYCWWVSVSRSHAGRWTSEEETKSFGLSQFSVCIQNSARKQLILVSTARALTVLSRACGSRTRTCKLVLEDKNKDFPRGQQHWVTVKNNLLTDIYQ